MCGGGSIIAGAGGAGAPGFLARSAIVARYARFACSLLMQSMYSLLGVFGAGFPADSVGVSMVGVEVVGEGAAGSVGVP